MFNIFHPDADYSWNPLTEEGYAEKLRLLREASQLPIDRWRATQVLAWLEVALGMPQYSARCAENVKSGKVLLELNDVELEAGLGLAHPMHRKKLRLAIEEQRRPEMVRYPLITQLGHTWVATEWLPDIGLPQYAEPFVQSLVDARMLDTLSKKELEKFLGVTRKFHQASIVHGKMTELRLFFLIIGYPFRQAILNANPFGSFSQAFTCCASSSTTDKLWPCGGCNPRRWTRTPLCGRTSASFAGCDPSTWANTRTI